MTFYASDVNDNFVNGEETCFCGRGAQCGSSNVSQLSRVCCCGKHMLGKQRTIPWPDAVAGAQGQGMGASSARSSKV